jgi:diguanylate cyclase (GGDEF)-like protein
MEHLPSLEAQARREVKRLESLWRIVNSPDFQVDDLIIAMLREATVAMRPGQAYAGTLGHIEGSEYVLDALAGQFDEREPQGLRVGLRFERSESIVVRDLDAGRTQSWDDCQALTDVPSRTRASGLRSQITTQFLAAGTIHVLTLGTREPPAGMPFGPEDYAYIELLGSIFARHIDLEHVQHSLVEAEARARQHAERLEALWQIANNPTTSGPELMLAMLRQAAVTIRPGQRFNGLLGRIEGNEVVVIGVGIDPDDDDPRTQRLGVGRRSPLDKTIIPRVGRTEAWEDLAATNDYPQAMALLGWRAVISAQFDAGGLRYSLTFASYEPTLKPFGTVDLAYLDVLATAFAKQLEVDQLENSLREEEERARLHAERLEALWKIVNDPSLRGEELLRAMLSEAAAAIRPDQEFRGMLWRVQGTDMIVEALSHPDHSPGNLHTYIGAIIPLDRTIIGKVLAEGTGTRSWDDVESSAYRSNFTKAHETRALIVTTFNAGAMTWGISFASTATARNPLGPQDNVYIEVLASFFANHVQQRWQFERLQYQQAHDVLTGLLNRSQFRSVVRSAARTSTHYAIILIDIDAFREFNESYGHMIGDALLVEVGNALRLRASTDEIVGRIGDDVFGVYIGNPMSKEFVLGRALSFAEAFSSGFSTGDRDGKEFIARTAGLGIAIAPEDGTVIDAILSHADAALVKAKERGHGSLIFYEAGMEGDAHRRTALRNEIAEAIAGDQFELYYQPHVEIATGNVTGCEALVRWNHPVRGLLLPQHFIPFAEQSGIIAGIDSWVMQNACAASNDLAALRPGFRLYFNLSGRQAGDPKMVRALTAAARRGVALENLGVEITETDAMRDVEATRRVCRALQRLNVRIAIDDFGTGYSSLSSLKRLPVDIVKIDRSFISGVLTDPHDETIADTIISIAARFGFESLAEGVEDLAEIGWLRQRPCRYMQGFAICHPLPIDAFKTWLGAHEG